jgi:MATE family multidrug resistance protein
MSSPSLKLRIYREFKANISLALPIILGQMGQMLLAIVDTKMVGNLGVIPVAACSFASSVTSIFLLIGIGFCIPVQVLVAQAFGAGKIRECRLLLCQGIWIVTLLSLVCGVVFQIDKSFLTLLGQDPEVLEASYGYMLLMIWGMIPALTFQCMKNYFESLRRPWLPLVVLGVGVLLNVVLNFVFIYGMGPIPSYGLTGAGIATLISRIVMFIILGVIVQRESNFLRYLLHWRFSRVRSMLKIGIPSAAQIFFEVGLFSIAAIMMGWINPETQAGHQIAINIAALAFMVPLGISFATSIRIGQVKGSHEYHKIRLIGFSSMLQSSIFMGTYAVFIVVFRHELAARFIEDVVVQDIAAGLLLMAAAFSVFDGIQISALGGLRGIQDVKVPTVFAFVVYWVASLPFAYYLAFYKDLKGIGIWSGMLTGLILASIVFTIRFHLKTRSMIVDYRIHGRSI